MQGFLSHLFDMVISVAMLLIFIRFMLQFAGLDRSNPYAMPAYKATQVVDVFGRIFPTVADGRISLAAIVLMFLLRLIDISGSAALANQGISPIELFFYGSLTLILDFLSMCRYLIIGSIVISWIVVFTQKMHPILGIIMQMAEPIIAPFRRLVPNVGMFDFSAIIALLLLWLAEKAISIIGANIVPMLG